MALAGPLGGPLLFGAVALYLLLPILAVLLYSLATRWTANVLPDGYTLAHWRDAFADPRLGAAFGRSLLLGLAVTVLDVLLVVPAATARACAIAGFGPSSSLRQRFHSHCRTSSSGSVYCA